MYSKWCLFLFFVLSTLSCLQAEENKTVMIAILARNKAHVLPKYLQCLENQRYDKKLISVYINTNNNQDATKDILTAWAEKNKSRYAKILIDSHEINETLSTVPHDWTPNKLKVLATIRNKSLKVAKELKCDYYFVADCDNFITPCTLPELISKNKPIIAPLLKSIPEKVDTYANFFCDVYENGYYKHHDDYWKILYREKKGTYKVPLVHCTYLINAKYIDSLNYIDDTSDYEFIVFARNARKAGVEQYICNEQYFGEQIHYHAQLSLDEEQAKVSELLSQKNPQIEVKKNGSQKTVLLAILAKNKAHLLPKYLSCIENLDYDKRLISVYINTNNNKDNTLEILQNWAKNNEKQYRNIELDNHNVQNDPQTTPHEWSWDRLKILADIRNKSLKKTKEYKCDYYFVVDCDNFITPCTLKELVQKDKPIIAPLLYSVPEPGDTSTNFFADVNDRGSIKGHPNLYKILFHSMVGTFKVPLVHCTYLINANYLDKLSYTNGTLEYEFIVFSKTARENGVDQYICNEKNFGVNVNFYGKLTLEEEKERMKPVLSTLLK